MARKNTYSDLDYRFTKDGSGNVKIVTEEDSIVQSIKTILSTRRGERIMLPTFGSSLFRYVFEQMDDRTAQLIQYDVDAAIRQWEDRIIVTNVLVDPDYDNNYYIISVRYRVLSTGQLGEFTAGLKSGL